MKKISRFIYKTYFSLYFKYIKTINYLRIYRTKIDSRKFGIVFISLIIIGGFIANLQLIPVIDDNINNYKNLVTNTGIALIGLLGIVFTLQIFNQEVSNNYTNSVIEKLVDSKFQHIIEYLFILVMTFLFLFVPQYNCFEVNLLLFMNVYFISLVVIFLIFGLDLFVCLNYGNKYKMIKLIEKKANRILDMVFKIHLSIDKYCKVTKQQNSSLTDCINGYNPIFQSYIQCINYILRTSIDDPILFSNGMDAYLKIIKNRLKYRKNQFQHVNIPFISELLPNNDNDAFIEKYMLEYLNEYSIIALKNNNRDILSIVQRTYFNMLILGRDNRYANNGEIELTIKVMFSYYLANIKMIVQYNNDNLLLDTVEMFKELFLKYHNEFYDLIDDSLYERIDEMFEIVIEKKSIMNYRTLQELISLTIYAIIYSEKEYNYLKLDKAFYVIKNSIYKLCTTKQFVKTFDGARLMLNFSLNNMEKYSIVNILTSLFNSCVDNNGKFIKTINDVDKLMKPYVDFFASKEILACIMIMNNDGRYHTGEVSYKSCMTMLSQILIKFICAEEYKEYKSENSILLRKCLMALNDICKNNESVGMRYKNINDIYCDYLLPYVFNHLKINKKCLEEVAQCYKIGVKFLYENNLKGRLELNDIYEYLGFILKFNLGEDEIIYILDWFYSNFELSAYKIYDDIDNLFKFGHLNEEILTFEDCNYIKNILTIKLQKELTNMDDANLDEFIKTQKIKIRKNSKKESKIDNIIKLIKN